MLAEDVLVLAHTDGGGSGLEHPHRRVDTHLDVYICKENV